MTTGAAAHGHELIPSIEHASTRNHGAVIPRDRRGRGACHRLSRFIPPLPRFRPVPFEDFPFSAPLPSCVRVFCPANGRLHSGEIGCAFSPDPRDWTLRGLRGALGSARQRPCRNQRDTAGHRPSAGRTGGHCNRSAHRGRSRAARSRRILASSCGRNGRSHLCRPGNRDYRWHCAGRGFGHAGQRSDQRRTFPLGQNLADRKDLRRHRRGADACLGGTHVHGVRRSRARHHPDNSTRDT